MGDFDIANKGIGGLANAPIAKAMGHHAHIGVTL